jgi:hypothetical protein
LLALNFHFSNKLTLKMNHIPKENCYPADKIIRINDEATAGLFKKAAKSMSSKSKSEPQKPAVTLKSNCKWTAA